MKTVNLEAWAEALSEDQAKQALVDVVRRMIETEDIRFYPSNLAPYWDASGEPLVPGQQVHKEES